MEYEILDNDIKLYKIKNERVSTIGISIGVNIGSIYEEKDKRGISHFLEHMNFKTNYKYTDKEIITGLELNGGISNASTWKDTTVFGVEVIPEGFEKILDILYTIIDNKKFLDEEFEKEKKVVLSEIGRYEADPTERLFMLRDKSIYGNSDYGDPIGGYFETINSIDKKDLEEFKEKYYVSKNMFIVLEGNFNDNIVEIVKKKFSKIENGDVKLKNPNKGYGENIIEKRNTEGQIYYSIGINLKKEDYIKVSSLSSLLSSGLSSLIFQIFRNKYGIGYVHELGEDIINDEIIFSFEIPGFEKDREKYLDDAIKDLLDYKVEKEYIEGRIKHSKIIFDTKLKDNIFKRIFIDAIYIKHFNMNVDQIFEEKIKEMKNYEENKYLIERLFDKGKKAIIYPNE